MDLVPIINTPGSPCVAPQTGAPVHELTETAGQRVCSQSKVLKPTDESF